MGMKEQLPGQKKGPPEGRPKSREETPKKGMQPKDCTSETTLHCKNCKPREGIFALHAILSTVEVRGSVVKTGERAGATWGLA